MNIEKISFLASSTAILVPLIVVVAKYVLLFSIERRKQKHDDYYNQMRVIDSYESKMSKKCYKRLKCEINFQVAYHVDLSDKVIRNIFKADRPKVILDNIKIAHSKLKISHDNQKITYRFAHKIEKAVDYFFGSFGLLTIALGGVTVHFQHDWFGLVIFLMSIIGGFALVIPVAQDLARYRAAKKVILAYNKVLEK